MLTRFIEHEYADPADMEMRGMLAALGIEKGKPFKPDRARATFSTRRQRPPTASAMRSPMSRRRSCPTAYGTRIGAGRTSFRAIRRLPRTPSTTSIRGRLLHLRLFDEPWHGGQHGECRREVPSDFRRR